ncbi:MAG TPA: bifunctional phosphoglucose/phosphomannose isomerase [candidate division Zixibacteria bacterium]|nr:bifunctional phosphoglucose/phosphomannose isomerase [candidate division Zixibacteria bacterium]MDD4917399.1 bifunctional phosphoglucose/phosphomannose isomerase [candidate division Zixibacteria bacterium]MDM7972397.1 bifunctional phosphoglucose/phosphomannose isomerase [candidate division Zixibacteria bacterium]HOD66201.1 bifunctional phosphoglucose/phosphomannose isomerase [candidate division Zixibacteria bacterium]HOZ07306.1 bifunctional phosphoglucose/phosphomannose isomerase [candidate 
MNILDDIEKIRAHDPENMYNRIFDFPEQLADAVKLGKLWKFDASAFPGIKNIVTVGMGGSGIAGDLMRSYLRTKLLVPVDICRSYALPEYVDDETLVVAASYSGNTEETLAAVDDALNRKAMLAAIATGGLLEEVAQLNDIPLAKLPGGLQPRAALGYLFVMTMMFLEQVGHAKGFSKELEKVIPQLQKHREKYIEDNSTTINPAKNLAQKLHKKIVIVYSGPTLTDAVGRRWKAQLCENAKTLAFANQFPEFNHNELVGWSPSIEELASHLAVVILRDLGDHPQVRQRMNIVGELIRSRGVEAIDVHSRGETELERMLSLVQFGDFVSYYLAILNEVDPTPVKIIDALKKALAEAKK